MIAFRQIYDDAPEFVQFSIPKELQHQRNKCNQAHDSMKIILKKDNVNYLSEIDI